MPSVFDNGIFQKELQEYLNCDTPRRIGTAEQLITDYKLNKKELVELSLYLLRLSQHYRIGILKRKLMRKENWIIFKDEDETDKDKL